MSLLFCRIFHQVLKNPRSLTSITLLISALSLFPIYKLNWDFSLLGLFDKEDSTRILAEDFQKTKGAIGNLSIIIESNDPSLNLSTAEHLKASLCPSPELRWCEYQKDWSFFKKNKLLYFPLDSIQNTHQTLLKEINPFFDNLDEDTKIQTAPNLHGTISPPKYNWIGNKSATLVILRLFPNYDITNPVQNSELMTRVEQHVKLLTAEHPKVSIRYAGRVAQSTQTEGKVLDEIINSITISFFLILGLMLIFFIRQPLIPLLYIIPWVAATLWTLAFSGIFFDQVNFLSLMLILLLLGTGTDSAIHLLSRYGEERRKKLGVFISLETVLLETAPSITLSAWTTAGSLLCLTLLPFQGMFEFGVTAAAAIIFNWINTLILVPSLLLLLQKKHLFKVHGKRLYNPLKPQKKPFTLIRISILAISVILFTFLPLSHKPYYENNLNSLGVGVSPNDSLLEALHENLDNPAILITPERGQLIALEQRVIKVQKSHPRLIQNFISSNLILPENQELKIKLLKEIRAMLAQAQLDSIALPKNILHELSDLDSLKRFGMSDLPQALKIHFDTSSQDPLHIAYIFPSLDYTNMDKARKFSRLFSNIKHNDMPVELTGRPILSAKFLRQTLPHMECVFWGVLIINFLLLTIDFRSVVYAFFVMIPTALASLLVIALMSYFKTPFHAFNLFLLPLFIGLSTDGSIHILKRYLEDKNTGIYWVMKRTGWTVFATGITTVLSFAGFLFSSMAMIQSIGLLALVAVCSSLLASLWILPIILTILDQVRTRNR
jgi:uncharacterized protein